MTVQPPSLSLTLESIAEKLDRPLLSENPFPTRITARNSAVADRFGEWAGAQRAKVEGDLRRLRSREEAPEDWELSAPATAVRQWRVFATFHQLHEERWCPALLFRLATKTDLLILCDRAADSVTSGFGERQKRVLSKRGIDHRLKWKEARRLVATMGLLEAAAPAPEEGVEATPDADAAGDGAFGSTEAAFVVATDARAEEDATEESPASEPVPGDSASPSATSPERTLAERPSGPPPNRAGWQRVWEI